MNWQKYYDEWDNFVKKWFERWPNLPSDGGVSEKLFRFIQTKNAAKQWESLDLNILPTPYLGFPDAGVEAVVMHMNPGLSEIAKYGKFSGKSTDATQSYANIDKPIGWLIREFRDNAECSYSAFLKAWSCLNPDLEGHNPQVCGWEWWNDEMEWIRRVYDNAQMSSSKVFALELCPYHSKRFGVRQRSRFNKELLPFIREHVIDVAIAAVQENKLPYAVALGAEFYKIFDRLEFPYEEWSFNKCETSCTWPPNSDDNPTRRTYRLYTVTSMDGVNARILVTWAQATGNPPPSESFKEVEKAILMYANNNVLL